jgi:two-component system sensor histidine kinase DesK
MGMSTETSPLRGAPLLERLRDPTARSWYIGAASGLLWQAILVVTVVFLPVPAGQKAAGLVLLALLYAAFMLIGPIIWHETTPVRMFVIAAYWAVSFALFPLIGPTAIWLWLLVVSLAAFTNLRLGIAISLSASVVIVQFVVAALAGFDYGLVFAPIVTTVTAATLIGLGFISRSNGRLRTANAEIARLAVVEERARFGRDLHDVLGHTLTVVTVKSELARRLVTIDPAKAEAEIADIENLTRGALADLRTAVSNYREIDLETELVAAETALRAAGIDAYLPGQLTPVDERVRGVFAWVLREGVTNVIRHSGATACWVTVDADRLAVCDDGRGPAASVSGAPGNGLRGLQERGAEAQVEVVVSRSEQGGFELTARRAA